MEGWGEEGRREREKGMRRELALRREGKGDKIT